MYYLANSHRDRQADGFLWKSQNFLHFFVVDLLKRLVLTFGVLGSRGPCILNQNYPQLYRMQCEGMATQPVPHSKELQLATTS